MSLNCHIMQVTKKPSFIYVPVISYLITPILGPLSWKTAAYNYVGLRMCACTCVIHVCVYMYVWNYTGSTCMISLVWTKCMIDTFYSFSVELWNLWNHVNTYINYVYVIVNPNDLCNAQCARMPVLVSKYPPRRWAIKETLAQRHVVVIAAPCCLARKCHLRTANISTHSPHAYPISTANILTF